MTCEDFKKQMSDPGILNMTEIQRDLMDDHFNGCLNCRSWVKKELTNQELSDLKAPNGEAAEELARKDDVRRKAGLN